MNYHQLRVALQKGNLNTLKCLITLDNVNDIYCLGSYLYLSALEWVCRYDHAACARWLLEDMNADVRESLIEAAWVQSFDCVRIVLYHCSKSDVNVTTGPRSDETALTFAVSKLSTSFVDDGKAIHIVKLLIQHGASVSHVNPDCPYQWIFEYDDMIRTRKRRCLAASKALYRVLRKRRVPKDLIRAEVEQFYVNTACYPDWDTCNIDGSK